jgi:hypothetical protein
MGLTAGGLFKKRDFFALNKDVNLSENKQFYYISFRFCGRSVLTLAVEAWISSGLLSCIDI